MNTRITIILFCLLSAICSFADNNNVTEARAYNSEWLDSVAYLQEHAKWKEPWALRALADCYRYGKGGVDKSVFNALMYYKEAGKADDTPLKKTYSDNPYDELEFMDKLMESLVNDRISEDEALSALSKPEAPQAPWARLLREILKRDKDHRKEYIESVITPDSTGDEFVIGIVFISMYDSKLLDNTFIGFSDYQLRNARIVGDKLLAIYDLLGEEMWGEYIRCEDKENKDKYLRTALEYLQRADQHGFLSRYNMIRILAYCEDNGIDILPPFSKDDLRRFEVIYERKSGTATDSTTVEAEEVEVETIEE